MSDSTPAISRAACDLCGSEEFELIARCDRRGRPLDTVLCRRCGLLVHRHVPSEQALGEYYRRQYRADYHGEFVPSPHRVIREWNRAKKLYRLLAPYVRGQDRLVEIGAGFGCTVRVFELAGVDATGIEPGLGFRKFANESLRARVLEGALETMPCRPTYGFALLVHVLEHLRSPSQSLRHIRSLLRDRGRLYVEVPNAAAPHAAPGKMFHFAHIYNFTPDTLSMLAGKAGFRVLRWLSEPRDKNIRVLLACGERTAVDLFPGSYAKSRQAMTAYNLLTYHVRWAYLRERMRTLCSHPCDHLLAGWRMNRILRQCQREGSLVKGSLTGCKAM